MKYQIKIVTEKIDWAQVEKIEIMHYPWGRDYMPKTYAWLYRVEGEGFYLKMRCEENEPKAIYKEDNDPVYKDSCMEFFANFYPEYEKSGYINFEMNSNGALLCEYGHPGERFYLKDKGFKHLKPIVTKGEGFWEVELMIPDTLIQAVYGYNHMTTSGMIKGNFYKCGDETQIAHYGCWNPIENEFPAFHKPEYFGELVLG